MHPAKPWIALAAALLAATPALAQSRRGGASEVYIAPVYTEGKSYSLENGGSAQTDGGVGLSLGYAHNFNPKISAGMDLAWTEQDFRATASGPAAAQLSGALRSGTVRFNGTFHFSDGSFTPFVTGGLGWTYLDSSIPAGVSENAARFSYSAGAGLRLDAGKGVFRVLANSQWVDFGGSYGTTSVMQYRLDIGTKF